MDSEEEADVFSDQSPQRAEEEEEEKDEEEKEGEEEDARIFNAWMQRCRGGEEEEEEGGEPESGLDPTVRRASLPCAATLSVQASLSSMQLSRLHSSTGAPVTAKVLLHRSSSRRLLPSPQEVAAPEGRPSLIPTIPGVTAPQRRRSSLTPTIPGVTVPERRRSSLIPIIPEVMAPERRSQFRRRNVMSLSDAYSVCLICHNDLSRGSEGTRELQCSHTFHRECIEEWLWRKQSCPTCHVQVSVPQPAYLSPTRVKVP